MSSNENLSIDASMLPALAGPSPLLAGSVPNLGWTSNAPEATSSVNVLTYVHAFRRHWLAATALGLLCMVPMACIAWWARGAHYSSFAVLQIAPSEPQLLPHTSVEGGAIIPNMFEIYKDTQSQLLKSRFVLEAALRKPEIAALPSIKRNEPDSVGWLGRELRVGFPGKAEIMEVEMTGDDPQEVTTLVNAVVEAYLSEVVEVERNERVKRKDQLDNLVIEKQVEVRRKRNELKETAEQYGTLDEQTLALKQQVTIQQAADYGRELLRVQFELMRARGEERTLRTYLANLEDQEITDYEVNAYAMLDPAMRNVVDNLQMKKMELAQLNLSVVPGAEGGSKVTKRYARQMDMAQQQYDQMSDNLRKQIRDKKRADTQMSLRRVDNDVAVLTEQEKQFRGDVADLRKEAEKLGRKSVDVEILRADLANLNQVMASIADEREKVKVELNSRSRIKVVQAAEPPKVESGVPIRWAITGLSGMAGFFLPVIGIVLWDTRSKRVNTVTEVSQGLRLPVIGAVPTIPAQILRRLGGSSKRSQSWRLRLTESIDSIAARLLHKAETEQAKVILVSSALAGEGKTTLATQIAMSLARHLRSTVLVDFDLRRPAMDGIFGVPLEPGVCEALRGQGDVGGMVHPTSTEHLSVMPAGRWDRQAMAALANGAAGLLFKQLRERYDFVIVDSSPVLPVADTRFVSQHADAVVLSVFRDLSEAPKIQATCEILEAFGVRNLQTVVTGGRGFAYGREREYEEIAPA